MTAEKMLRILLWLEACGVKPGSIWIGLSAGSEITIEPNGQLPNNLHSWMLARGFVYFDDAYIYRPRKKNASS